MKTSSEVATVALTPELMKRLAECAQGLSMSPDELICNVLERYLDQYLWKELLRYGHERGKASGYGPEDVPRLIEEVRAEMAPKNA